MEAPIFPKLGQEAKKIKINTSASRKSEFLLDISRIRPFLSCFDNN